MTVSSVDIHGVTSIMIDDARELEGFNSTVYSRHIRITGKDAQGSIHHLTILVYSDKAGDLDFTFTHKEEK
jgi:hypothetical protein